MRDEQRDAARTESEMPSRKVRIQVNALELSGERDPILTSKDQLRFLVYVSIEFDSARSVTSVIPSA